MTNVLLGIAIGLLISALNVLVYFLRKPMNMKLKLPIKKPVQFIKLVDPINEINLDE